MVIHYAHATVSEVAIMVVGGISYAVVWIIGQIIALVTYCLIAVANYNDFSTSIAISTGWVVLRDVANMFFIIIFLVIAFGTMLGEDIAPQYHYKKTLIRFIMMAILINFSKTIAGFVIDIGQVIMMTFVNGFSAAAGGNFLEVMQIRELTAMTTYQGVEIGTIDIVGGLLLAMVVALVSLICMVVLTMILVARVVALWLLVVVSPLAFFAAAVPMNSIQKFYSQWWGMLVQNVMVGPLLAFFIWLSLAVVSNSAFNTEMEKVAAGATAEKTTLSSTVTAGSEGAALPSAGPGGIGTPEIMLKYLIGIALLMGGLALAKQTGAAGASFAAAGDKWIRKGGSATAKWMGRQAYKPVSAIGRRAGEVGFGLMAGSRIPLVSGLGAKQVVALRKKEEAEGKKASAYVSKLTPKEVVARRDVLKGLGMLRTKKQDAEFFALSDSALKNLRYKGEATDKDKALAAELMANNERRAKMPGGPGFSQANLDFKKARPDLLLTEKDKVAQFKAMDNMQLLKNLAPQVLKDKETLTLLKNTIGEERWKKLEEKGNKDWKDAIRNLSKKEPGKEEKEAAQKELAEADKIKDPAARKEAIQAMGEKVANLPKESITQAITDALSGEQIEILLKADNLSISSLSVEKLTANDNEIAGKVAEHGTKKQKDNIFKRIGNKWTETMKEVRQEQLIKQPNFYTPPAMAASKEIMSIEHSPKNAFNVSVENNFAEEKDKNAFKDVIKNDPDSVLNLRPEEMQGQVMEIIQEAVGNKKSLRDLAKLAQSDEEKDAFEQIVKTAHKNAIQNSDQDMINFLEMTRGVKNYISQQPEETQPKAEKTSKMSDEDEEEEEWMMAEEDGEKAKKETLKDEKEKSAEGDEKKGDGEDETK